MTTHKRQYPFMLDCKNLKLTLTGPECSSSGDQPAI